MVLIVSQFISYSLVSSSYSIDWYKSPKFYRAICTTLTLSLNLCICSKVYVDQGQRNGGTEGAFGPPLFREMVLICILQPIHFSGNSTKDTKKVNFATPLFKDPPPLGTICKKLGLHMHPCVYPQLPSPCKDTYIKVQGPIYSGCLGCSSTPSLSRSTM